MVATVFFQSDHLLLVFDGKNESENEGEHAKET